MEEVRRQHALVADAEATRRLLDDLPFIALVVNAYRQIVYANRAAAAMLGVSSAEFALGRRFGEAIACRHSRDLESGCGTTEYCLTCGAATALLATETTDAPASRECRIASLTLGRDLDLRVWTRRFQAASETFTLVTLMDIGGEKRRVALERVFFHDVLNTAAAIRGLVAMLADPVGADAGGDAWLLAMLDHMSAQLVEDVEAQRDLLAVERGDLKPTPELVRTRELSQSIVDTFARHELTAGRTLAVAADAEDLAMATDARLLRRVLTNMVKNALEGCPAGGTVTLTVTRDRAANRVRFGVHNPSAMPPDVQRQVFQRSFSTKGAGRGLGTYSMKLLTERYLQGHIAFRSTPETGTTFIADYPAQITQA
jgi:hypothetical protein